MVAYDTIDASHQQLTTEAPSDVLLPELEEAKTTATGPETSDNEE